MSNWTKEEQKEHRAAWVKALRSGKYKQGITVLRNTEDQYCCLGVACEVAGVTPPITRISPDRATDYEYEDMYPPKYVVDYFGLSDDNGCYNQETDSLTHDNDTHCLSFDQIADIIESEPEGLFV